jgi:uncharacterized protein
MRRKERTIHNQAVILEHLRICHIGRLGTIGKDGYPRVKPLCFAYHDGNLYFHTATQGEKVEDIARDNRVCFEVDLPIAYVKATHQPCAASYLFRSVIIQGRAHWVQEDSEKILALNLLMQKYQPDGVHWEYRPEQLAVTGVVRIGIEAMEGKEHLGAGQLREAAVQLLENPVQPPILHDDRRLP